MVAALASAFVFSLLRGRTTKLVFSAVAGVLLMQLTFGALWVVVLCHAVTSYVWGCVSGVTVGCACGCGCVCVPLRAPVCACLWLGGG